MKLTKTITSKEDLTLWADDEKNWWNKFSDIMNIQWELDHSFNKVIRRSLKLEYTRFLGFENETVLDFGCGAGLYSIELAESGLNVTGLDSSHVQIEKARELAQKKGLNNVEFYCGSLDDLDAIEGKKFDAVFLSAILHHLPYIEIQRLIDVLHKITVDGARLFMYEPIYVQSEASKTNIFDKIINGLMIITLFKIPNLFNLHTKAALMARKDGYNGLSPHEAPIEMNELIKLLSDKFKLVEIKAAHVYSLNFAMQSMLLVPWYRNLIRPIVYPLKFVDFLMSQSKWASISHKDRFILCSIKCEK